MIHLGARALQHLAVPRELLGGRRECQLLRLLHLQGEKLHLWAARLRQQLNRG